jgi:tetratricopeptide (TPR) repeat protein
MSSQEIFELRRNGDLLAGYNLGKKLLSIDPSDNWVLKAFSYCTLDLAKKFASESKYDLANSFLQEVKALACNGGFIDGMLRSYIIGAESAINPENKILNDAKDASKKGERDKALVLYRLALNKNPEDVDISNSLGWELYHKLKKVTNRSDIPVLEVRGLLVEYMRLFNERPSLLHSRMMDFALKIADQDDFHGFIKAWDLNNFRAEDYERYKGGDKTYPSLVEKVLQKAAKKAYGLDDALDVSNYIIPFLNLAIDRYPDNQWLVYYKAKILHKIGLEDEALKFAVNFVKKKTSDFWSWGLLADVVSAKADPALTLSCYCKSLLCEADDEFLVKIRVNLAKILIDIGFFEQAKFELSKAISTYEKNKWSIKDELSSYTYSDWYKNTICPQSNLDFYKKNIGQADDLLFSAQPWLKAVLGEKFEINQDKPKIRRKIYVLVEGNSVPLECSVPERKFDFSELKVGDGLFIKGELDKVNKFNIFILKKRDTILLWDVFSDLVGVVDHINLDKSILHFIIDKNMDGVLKIDKKGVYSEGDFVSAKMFIYYKKDGTVGYGTVSLSKTEQQPSPNIFRRFNDSIDCCSDGLSFTKSGVFIDRDLTRRNNIEDDCHVEGFAVLNFNRKRKVWGWKAVKIILVSKQDNHNDLSDDLYFESDDF